MQEATLPISMISEFYPFLAFTAYGRARISARFQVFSEGDIILICVSSFGLGGESGIVTTFYFCLLIRLAQPTAILSGP